MKKVLFMITVLSTVLYLTAFTPCKHNGDDDKKTKQEQKETPSVDKDNEIGIQCPCTNFSCEECGQKLELSYKAYKQYSGKVCVGCNGKKKNSKGEKCTTCDGEGKDFNWVTACICTKCSKYRDLQYDC